MLDHRTVVQLFILYTSLAAGQPTVAEGDDTCDARHAIMDRLYVMENIMNKLMDRLDKQENKSIEQYEQLVHRVGNLENINTKQYEQLANRVGKLEEHMVNLENKTVHQVHKVLHVVRTTTMLRRHDGSLNFENRSWADYKGGFGDKDGEFWLGLDNLHEITTLGSYGLNVTMAAWDGKSFWAYYSSIGVGPESDNYRLSVSGYDVSSTAPDNFWYHNNMQFSTKDRDNDQSIGICSAIRGNGGWWYNDCTLCNPTGLYVPGGVTDAKGIFWSSVPGYPWGYSLKQIMFSLICN